MSLSVCSVLLFVMEESWFDLCAVWMLIMSSLMTVILLPGLLAFSCATNLTVPLEVIEHAVTAVIFFLLACLLACFCYLYSAMQANCCAFLSHAEADDHLYPGVGIYRFTMDTGETICFELIHDQDSEGYDALMTTAEVDKTITTVRYTIDESNVMPLFVNITPAQVTALDVTQDGTDYVLRINQQDVMNLNRINDDLHIGEDASLVYLNNTVFDSDGELLLEGISAFYYCDKYRVYTFFEEKINPISGPGTLFWSQDMQVAIYVLNSPDSPFSMFVSIIEEAIHPEGSSTNIPATSSTPDDNGLLVPQEEEVTARSPPQSALKDSDHPVTHHREDPTPFESVDQATLFPPNLPELPPQNPKNPNEDVSFGSASGDIIN